MIEGSAGHGRAVALERHGEWVIELDRPTRKEKDGSKSDALDAARAAREMLGRKLNRALYLVAVPKRRCDPPTKADIARRVAEGKTEREAIRCVKRFVARRVWRLLERPPISPDRQRSVGGLVR